MNKSKLILNKYSLGLNGLTYADIAREFGVSRELVRVLLSPFDLLPDYTVVDPHDSERIKQPIGFRVMDRQKRLRAASMGGKAAHAKGTAHEWTVEEARAAGRVGGRRKRPK